MHKRFSILLLVSVFIIATCGLIYELISGTLASYLLGDSVTQFSTIIGVYLFSMGLGSWVSKYFEKNLLTWFIRVEILVGLVGGTSSTILFLVFESVSSFRIVLYGLISFTGILVGLEIPLLMRILKDRFEFKELVSKVFTFDYIGALIASLVFPLLLIPFLGLIKTAYLFGMLNVLVALVACIVFKNEVKGVKYLKSAAIVSLVALFIGFLYSEKITSLSESLSFSDPIIFSKSTPYQRIIITKKGRDLRLFLNGNLQFSSVDEYRYHEALIHPVLQALPNAKNILVMGGGDGLAVREILKYPQIQTVTLVDLDKEMTHLFRTNDMLVRLNQRSLLSPKITVVNVDAFSWARAQNKIYDAIIVDFPDPSNYSVGKLYTNTFYSIVKRLLAPDGIMVVQSTSPFVAPKSYWTVDKTLQSVGFHTVPYHDYVPSFGEWGYIMAMRRSVYKVPDHYLAGLRFMSKPCLEQMLFFPKDMARVPASINRLNNQILVKYFEDEWSVVQ
ncbi:polyamine aminopropyltransferase [Mucilaginibacter sp. BJC16-A38]|uniref:polyamine aminopropyltransferase n=1 Tax=Mucilaginibacter phenanthrenivorans TaxID=1234842 RepID=UPI0021574D62|nr:polyamine aminopropyltransferase [Mucilaginibacter phenanthrenivorans]MCR8560367.1 polyamine aminopropyltransferase [Mucilaginibacter phenanthrenivorans]